MQAWFTRVPPPQRQHDRIVLAPLRGALLADGSALLWIRHWAGPVLVRVEGSIGDDDASLDTARPKRRREKEAEGGEA